MKRLWEDQTPVEQEIIWNAHPHFWLKFELFGKELYVEIPAWLYGMLGGGK